MTMMLVVDTRPSPFHSSVSHSVSLCFVSSFHWLLLASGLPNSVSLVARAAYIVWFRGSWLEGALVSAQWCVGSFTHRVRVWRLLWLLPALFCLIWPPFQSLGWYHGWYNAITILQVTDVANWPADHPAFFVLWFVVVWCLLLVCLFCCLFWFVFFLLASWQLIGLCTGPTSVQLLKPTFVRWMTSLLN